MGKNSAEWAMGQIFAKLFCFFFYFFAKKKTTTRKKKCERNFWSCEEKWGLFCGIAGEVTLFFTFIRSMGSYKQRASIEMINCDVFHSTQIIIINHYNQMRNAIEMGNLLNENLPPILCCRGIDIQAFNPRSEKVVLLQQSLVFYSIWSIKIE